MKKEYLIILMFFLIFPIFIISGCYQQNSNKENVENFSYEQEIMNKFTPIWRITNDNCYYYFSQKEEYNQRYNQNSEENLSMPWDGEISYTLNVDEFQDNNLLLNKTLDCTLRLNNNPSYKFTIAQEIEPRDKAYIGKGSVFENHTITLCCDNVECKIYNLNSLCSL